MKLITPMLILVLLFVTACSKDEATGISDESFLPMKIGNYWKNDDNNYIEIQDSVKIGDNVYYKFFSLIGGDGILTRYLRIDEKNRLLESYPSQPGKEYLHAKFDADLNEIFFTLNDKTVNDYKVELVEKSEQIRTFEFDMVYHPNLKGHPHRTTYVKGLGYSGWKTVKIN